LGAGAGRPLSALQLRGIFGRNGEVDPAMAQQIEQTKAEHEDFLPLLGIDHV
jgi:hypothetical protein